MEQQTTICGTIQGDILEVKEEFQLKLDRRKLQYARDRLGYTLDMVGEKSGVSKNTARRAEHEQEIRPSTARKIAAGLGVEVSDLIRDPREPD